MTRPIRVLFAIPALDRGGPDRVLYELLCSLDRARFAPSLVVCSPAGDYLSKLPADVTVEVLGDGGGMRQRYPLRKLLGLVRRTRPDVVLGTQRMIIALGLIAPAFGRTRLVLRQANDVTADFSALVRTSLVKHRLARWLTLTNLRHADAVVCQSLAMQRDLERLLGARANLHVIGNPVDVDAITRAATATSVTLPGSPALVSVGRLAPQKGYDILLPALAQVRRAHPHVHLTILGDGPDRGTLEALASEVGVADAVTFAGFTSTPLPALRAADLFVLASRYEGFPNAALEALACGTPVVLTDCPGANAEIVEAGVNGRLATSVEPAAMARAIEAALAERAGYDRARIQERCRERFASSRIAAAYEQMFATVVAQPAAEAG